MQQKKRDILEVLPEGVLLHVLVQPRASKSEVVGVHGDPPRVKIRISAPPVEGEANEELMRFLKKKLKIPSLQLQMIRGMGSRTKDVLITGMDPDTIRMKLLDT